MTRLGATSDNLEGLRGVTGRKKRWPRKTAKVLGRILISCPQFGRRTSGFQTPTKQSNRVFLCKYLEE
jgi:hypothetical protein